MWLKKNKTNPPTRSTTVCPETRDIAIIAVVVTKKKVWGKLHTQCQYFQS